MQTITREELHAKITAGEPFWLFEVLGPQYFRKAHLPGALNMPPNAVRETLEAHTVPREADVVLYCWDPG